MSVLDIFCLYGALDDKQITIVTDIKQVIYTLFLVGAVTLHKGN